MQRMTGRMPTPQEARDEFTPIVEKVARKSAEPKPVIKAAAPRPQASDEQLSAAYKKAAEAAGMPILSENIHIVRGTGDDATVTTRKQTRAQRKDERMRRNRLRLLWALPDWQARIKAVDILSAQGFRGPDAKRQAEFQYTQILEDSERVFGPYWKARSKKHYSTGNGKRGTIQS